MSPTASTASGTTADDPKEGRAARKPKVPKVPKPPKAPKLTTTIADDGLRYRTKTTGSPFVNNQGSFTGSTLSCLFCGKHRRSNERITQKVAGRNQQVCEPPCETNPRARKLAAAAAAKAATPGQATTSYSTTPPKDPT